MRAALGCFWYVYFIGSWSASFLVFQQALPVWSLYIILLVGLVFYTTKLYYLNNLTLTEINYVTILFDLIMYAYMFVIGSGVWMGLYLIWIKVDAAHFHSYFPTMDVYYMVARRMVMLGAAMGLGTFVSSGGNHSYSWLKFTNKIFAIEAAFVFLALVWVAIDIRLIGMFVSIVTVWSMPDHVKHVFKKKDIDLINVKIENNMTDVPYPPYDLIAHIVTLAALILTPAVFNGLVTHLPLALLGLGSIIIFQTPVS